MARHAGAGRASVWVTAAPVNTATVPANQIAEIQVEDDGKGMAPDTPFGLGLTGIEERVQALGGALTLTKRHPQGLCVRAWIPVQAMVGPGIRTAPRPQVEEQDLVDNR